MSADRPIIYRADYLTERAEIAAIVDGELIPDLLEYETVEAKTLREARDTASARNHRSDECYNLRSMVYEDKMDQYCPDEYYCPFTLEVC